MEYGKDTYRGHEEVIPPIIYKNGDLAFFNDFSKINMPDVYRSEIYVIGLVLEGKASMRINDREYEIHKNQIFVCQPTDILEHTMISVDFKCECICMAPTYARRIIPIPSNAWGVKMLLDSNPVYMLQPEEAEVFHKYYDLFCTETHLPTATQEELIDALILAFSYYMHHVMRQFIQSNTHPYTTGERHLQKFIELLETSFPKNRSLGYYADQLHVTPKYLSGICKKLMGQTASRLIARYVAKDIEYRLKFSQKSIKEIANEMEFPTLSFFGRYVKKHLGMSPKELREEYRKKRNA